MTEQHNLYLQRINRVLNYIREPVAESDLLLPTLAGVAGFSPFHFHRIFKAITGETLNECVVRLRLERTAALLKSDPTLAIGAAALSSGFASASNFSRLFKKQYGISPRRWDRHSPLNDRKIRQVLADFPRYPEAMLHQMAAQAGFQVRLRDLPALMRINALRLGLSTLGSLGVLALLVGHLQ